MIKLNSGADTGHRNQYVRVVNSLAVAIGLAPTCYDKNLVSLQLTKKKKPMSKSLIALAVGFAMSGFSTGGYALGVGSATADSYIGEVLIVRVPLFNVENPESLTVKLTQSEGSVAKLQAQINRANSQLGIAIRSDQRVNEPYLNFTLDLSDGGNVFSKEFTVLLNLSTRGPGSNSARVRDSENISAKPLGVDGAISGGSLMGPYEWAEAGSIPEKFGAVLDGQSLWRVARRINGGLGVSINQMMWSLYQQNPDAFSNSSINSLKAGSYLKIPSFQMASQLSDGQAKEQLDSTLLNSSLVSTSDVDASAGQAQEQLARGVESESPDVPQQFQLTSLDETVSADGSVTGVTDSKSQEIISSLAETVGNLTQELIRKDKQISFLEEKVSALAEFAGVDNSLVDTTFVDEPSDSLTSVDTMGEIELESSPLLAELDDDEVGESELAPSAEDVAESQLIESELTELELSEPEELSEFEELSELGVSESEASQYDAELVSSRESDKSLFQKLSQWHWVGLVVAGLLLLMTLFRRRLGAVFGSLNLFGKDNEVEFKQSVFDATDGPIGNVDNAQASTERDYSVMSSVKRELDKDEAIEGVSYLSVDEDGVYEEADSSEVSEGDLEFVNDEDMTFPERFERLIKDKDFDFARELLDFARYNEIDDERYHCERLRLLQAMKDEDGFYEYYYEIESKIPGFAPNYQTQISQLVVELAQHED